MGSGASALLDVASDLKLNHEQRKRYRALYLDLAKTGKTPQQIIAILQSKIDEEKKTGKPAELTAPVGGDKHGNRKLSQSMGILPILDTSKISESPVTVPQSSARPNSAQGSKPNNSMDSARGSMKDSQVKLSSRAPEVAPTTEAVDEEEASTENILESLLTDYDDASTSVQCKLCKVAFESLAQLKRHINFSQLHGGNAKDYAQKRSAIVRAKKITKLVHAAVEKLMEARELSKKGISGASRPRQLWRRCLRKLVHQNRTTKAVSHLYKTYNLDPGTVIMDPLRILFEGSKLFWRTGETIDLVMYLHNDTATRAVTTDGVAAVEVAGYNRATKREVERIFISFEAVVLLLDGQIRDSQDPKQKANPTARRRSLGSAVVAEDIHITNEMVVDYIQSHLELVPFPGRAGFQRLVLAASATDVDTKSFSNVTLGSILGFKPTVVPGAASSTAGSTSSASESSSSFAAVASIAAIAHAVSPQFQAQRLLSIQIAPMEAAKIRRAILPAWGGPSSVSERSQAVASTIADLKEQTNELLKASKTAQHFSTIVAHQLAPFIANPHKPSTKPVETRTSHARKGGVQMETVASAQHRKRRNSLG